MPTKLPGGRPDDQDRVHYEVNDDVMWVISAILLILAIGMMLFFVFLPH
jgi:hypothetical protein